MPAVTVRLVPSPLGPLLLAAGPEGVVRLALAPAEAAVGGGGAGMGRGPAGGRAEPSPLRAARRWLEAYFAGERPDPQVVPLAPRGTPYQRRVWEALRRIPQGATATYGEVAARAGGSPRSVGGAAGANPIALLIPCHRVLAAGGRLGGFSAGVGLKARLLAFEGACALPHEPATSS